MDFDYYTEYLKPEKEVSWYCIDGGTSLLPEAMREKLHTKPNLGQRVKAMALERPEGTPGQVKGIDGSTAMKVKVNNEKDTRRYAAVFNTTTLACLQRIDLTGLELLYEQKDAIRSLHYDTASKVGMKFRAETVNINGRDIKRPWWIKYGIIKGGLGKTDMPLRTWYAALRFQNTGRTYLFLCSVYPSYNVDDETETYVLLASYCVWISLLPLCIPPKLIQYSGLKTLLESAH